jgi:hypothetical protein
MNHWSTYEHLATDHRADLERDALGGGRSSSRWQADSVTGSRAAAPAGRLHQATARLRDLVRSGRLGRARA